MRSRLFFQGSGPSKLQAPVEIAKVAAVDLRAMAVAVAALALASSLAPGAGCPWIRRPEPKAEQAR